MPDNRRTPRGAARGGPRGRTGPGRGSAGRSARPAAVPAGSAPRPGSPRRRPRLTGRAGVLVLVLAVLAVSYASSLRAFLQQREHMQELQTQIAERQANIEALDREKRRWQDPEYVEQQARERLGYVMPGETAYVVLDEDGDPLQPQATLSDPADVDPPEPKAWWTDAWGSVELAGDPPRSTPPPLDRIDGSEEVQP